MEGLRVLFFKKKAKKGQRDNQKYSIPFELDTLLQESLGNDDTYALFVVIG